MMTGPFSPLRAYPPTSEPHTPAAVTFSSAASTGISGSANSISSVLPGSTLAAATIISAIGISSARASRAPEVGARYGPPPGVSTRRDARPHTGAPGRRMR